jgi:hypothetical protein
LPHAITDAKRNLLLDAGLTFTRKKKEGCRMSIKIIDVDQLDNRVLVNFEDGVCALYDADFLYAQTDKHIQADFDESSTQEP